MNHQRQPGNEGPESMRIMVDVGGGERKRCTVIESPATGDNGGLWARAKYRGEEFAVVELGGAWLKQSVWDHICKTLRVSGRNHDVVRRSLRKSLECMIAQKQ